MIISIDAEKEYYIIQQPFMIKKNSQKLEIKGNILNLILKNLQKNPTANIIFNNKIDLCP